MRRIFLHALWALFLVGIAVSGSPALATAQQDRPPAPVVTAPASEGLIAPTTEYIGSLDYAQLADVSGEISGLVASVHFEAGDAVQSGDTLVQLESTLLEGSIREQRAALAQSEVQLEQSKLRLQRIHNLYKRETVSEQEYDDARLTTRALEQQVAGHKAKLARLHDELQKKRITAPFTGIILEKHLSQGEWFAPGQPVATLAGQNKMDAVFPVDQQVLPFIHTGQALSLTTAETTYQARIQAVIRQGDAVSRTVPVKLRFTSDARLAAGIEARAAFPTGHEAKGFLVPREAVLEKEGRSVLYIVREQKVFPIEVAIIGYRDDAIGVQSDKLQTGAEVVIKGNERLQPGQSVRPSSRQTPATEK